jgi:site-specific recombinase XerC
MTHYDLGADVVRRLGKVSPHLLRHALATIANREGISEATSGKILGHAASGTTARYISHDLDEALLAVADRLVKRLDRLMAEGVSAYRRRQDELLEPVELVEDLPAAKASD